MDLQQILEWYGFIGLVLGIVFVFSCTILEKNIKTFFSALLLSPLVVAFWPIVIYEWITGRQFLLKIVLGDEEKDRNQKVEEK